MKYHLTATHTAEAKKRSTKDKKGTYKLLLQTVIMLQSYSVYLQFINVSRDGDIALIYILYIYNILLYIHVYIMCNC